MLTSATSTIPIQPFFSVIMCTYNRAALLPRALDSLVSQTESDWEAIIVDDGSTDATPNVVQPYLERFANIRYTHRENGGIGMARTTGLQAALGRFLTFLDSDDEYVPEHLASRKYILCDTPAIEFLHGGMDIIGNPYVPDKNDPSRLIHISECVVGGTFVVRCDVARTLGGFSPLRFGDDAVFYEKAQKAGVVIATTNLPTYRYYRTTVDSLCTTAFQDVTA